MQICLEVFLSGKVGLSNAFNWLSKSKIITMNSNMG